MVLSAQGWVRAAKGHDIDARELNYKAGDAFMAEARGRSNQLAVFIDSTGRCYTLPAHTLPSARSQGEPLNGRLQAPPGAGFAGVMLGSPDDFYLLASDAGYGFVAKLGDLYSKNKTGKAVLSVPRGAAVLAPARVSDMQSDRVVAVTRAGHLLVHPLTELPLLAKGKGIKIIGIPAARRAERCRTPLRPHSRHWNESEARQQMAAVAAGASLTLHAGQRHLTLKPADLSHYQAERGRRGLKLPRGFQRVERINPEDK